MRTPVHYIVTVSHKNVIERSTDCKLPNSNERETTNYKEIFSREPWISNCQPSPIDDTSAGN